MPKCSKYHAKWQILVPNCCKYKANGTRKESRKKIQELFWTLSVWATIGNGYPNRCFKLLWLSYFRTTYGLPDEPVDLDDPIFDSWSLTPRCCKSNDRPWHTAVWHTDILNFSKRGKGIVSKPERKWCISLGLPIEPGQFLFYLFLDLVYNNP